MRSACFMMTTLCCTSGPSILFLRNQCLCRPASLVRPARLLVLGFFTLLRPWNLLSLCLFISYLIDLLNMSILLIGGMDWGRGAMSNGENRGERLQIMLTGE